MSRHKMKPLEQDERLVCRKLMSDGHSPWVAKRFIYLLRAADEVMDRTILTKEDCTLANYALAHGVRPMPNETGKQLHDRIIDVLLYRAVHPELPMETLIKRGGFSDTEAKRIARNVAAKT